MSLATLLLQIVTPLALVGTLFAIPVSSMAGLAIPVLSVATVLLAMSLVFLSGIPPTWIRYLYGALWFITALYLLSRTATAQIPILPSGAGDAGLLQFLPCCSS